MFQVRYYPGNGDQVSPCYSSIDIKDTVLILTSVVQAGMNVAAATGACIGPLAIGALTRTNPHTGWRNFYVLL